MKLSLRLFTRFVLALPILVGAVVTATPQQAVHAAPREWSVGIGSFGFTPSDITINQGDTVVWTNSDRFGHTTTEDTRLWDSRTLTQFQSFRYTFFNSGSYNYYDDTRPAIRGRINVVPAPTYGIVSPTDKTTLTTFGPNLQWTNPPEARQVQLQVIPALNDGPGVDLVFGSPITSFQIPAPPNWYGLLPDMTYTWRIRSTPAEVFVPAEHPSWTPWSTATFRTGPIDSTIVSAASPAPGATVSSVTPTLTWASSRPDVFYFEVQVAKDPLFNPDPATAIGPIYWALIHGGVSTPADSYVIPASAPLERNTTYYWRVRPRIQGDGTPVPFSGNFSFRTP